MLLTNENKQPFMTRLAMTLVSVIAICYIVILGKEVLSPLAFSFLFASLLLPVARLLENKLHLGRAVAAGLSILLLLLLLVSSAYFLTTQITTLTHQWPAFEAQYKTVVQQLENWVNQRFHVNINQQLVFINEQTDKLAKATPLVLRQTVLSLSSLLVFLIFLLLDTFFILLYRRSFVRFLIAVWKSKTPAVVSNIVTQVQAVVRNYILGILIETVLVVGLSALAFWMIGLRYVLLLALLTGILNLIPYVGILIALITVLLVTVGTSASGYTVFLLLLSIVLIHLFDSYVLRTVLIGSRVKINAFVTLIGVVVGQLLWGISGMFLAVPVIAACKIFFDQVEALKPWGDLLGDNTRKTRPPIPFRKKEK